MLVSRPEILVQFILGVLGNVIKNPKKFTEKWVVILGNLLSMQKYLVKLSSKTATENLNTYSTDFFYLIFIFVKVEIRHFR